MPTSRNRQRQAECAAEHWLRKELNCINTVRAVQTKWQRQDMFACDVLGKCQGSGQLIGVQVTCGGSSAVAARRRKLEAIEWAAGDMVLLAELRCTKVSRKNHWWFRVHELNLDTWEVWNGGVEVPKEWFRAWKK